MEHLQDYIGKEEDAKSKEGVVYAAATCAGTSGGLVVPLVYTEEKAGDEDPWRHQYVHSGATAVDRGNSTDDWN